MKKKILLLSLALFIVAGLALWMVWHYQDCLYGKITIENNDSEELKIILVQDGLRICDAGSEIEAKCIRIGSQYFYYAHTSGYSPYEIQIKIQYETKDGVKKKVTALYDGLALNNTPERNDFHFSSLANDGKVSIIVGVDWKVRGERKEQLEYEFPINEIKDGIFYVSDDSLSQ